MNSSLLAGLGAGTGLVLVVGLTAGLLLPPPQDPSQQPPTADAVSQPVEPEVGEAAETDPVQIPEPDAPATEPDVPPADEEPPALVEAPISPPSEPVDAEQAQVGIEPPDEIAELAEPEPGAEDQDTEAFRQTEVIVPGQPEADAEIGDEGAPQMPSSEEILRITRLPSAVVPPARSEGAAGLPQITLPQVPTATEDDAVQPDGAAAPETPPAPIVQQEPQPMPGLRVAGLPQIGADAELPSMTADLPEPRASNGTALERNSLYQGGTAGQPRMALVLSDPGLPAPMRRDLAAMDIPITIALNPLDSSAAAGAEIYRDAGKEALILATSLPEGATASDLDVTFNAFFEALPQAVGVIDLPEDGFARNSAMLNDILPLLAQDGHGLITFAGGLAQAARATEAAGIAHAEVFRMLERGSESAFTIRRYIDRAMFHASQTGEVIVFGDASNDATMEAIEMWLADGRAEQIAVVPISAILMQAE